MSVKSNYNFVPAPTESEVYIPDWGEQISHDIPFEDGESGEIEISITAKTPIFVRNGHARETGERAKEIIKQWGESKVEPSDEEDLETLDRYLSFSNIKDKEGNKKYFIPATSLKGMLRNVLEIMSRSRIKVDNDIFSLRDIDHPTYKSEVSSRLWNNSIKKGWLKKMEGKWIIEECDAKRVDLRATFKAPSYAELSAADKYEQMKGKDFIHHFSRVEDLGVIIKGEFKKTDELYRIDPNGSFKGELVYFGGMESKKYEFAFSDPTGDSFKVSDSLMQRFLAIDIKLKDSQWQYYIKNGFNKFPVFFYSSDGENVDHFGFSKLYKLSNTRYLDEIQPLFSYRKRKSRYRLDLAECIFGTVADTNSRGGTFKNETTLKGRIFVGNGKIQTKIEETAIENTSVVLSSPKASYYPFYVEDRNTYYDKNAAIRGYKKYPIHNAPKESILHEDNKDIESIIRPLPVETRFISKIRFHNLNKIEVGALLSAITLHGNEDKLFHSIGSGKPLGFGKIKIKVEGLHFQDKKGVNKNEYLAAFEEEMNRFYKDWLNSYFMKELFAMAMTANPDFERDLVYPTLDPNEFKDFKTEGLERYSSINGVFAPESIYSSFLEKQKQTMALALEKQEIVDFKLVESAKDILSLESFKYKYPKSKHIPYIDQRIKELRDQKKTDQLLQAKKDQYTTKSYKWDEVVKWPKDKLKRIKNYQFTAVQQKDIEVAIRQCFELEKKQPGNRKNRILKGQLPSFHEFPWTDMRKWLPEKTVEQLYEDFKKALS